MGKPKKTLVINMFAGPGAGKTTCAWEVASELKKQGYVTEYVPEYAKELVWDGNMDMLDGSLNHQLELLNEQERRLNRLVGKVDFIVTDSPILLNPVYLSAGTPEERQQYTDTVVERFNRHHNFCVFIQRGKTFETEGRIHDAQQSREIDNKITDILKHYGVYCGVYTYKTVHHIVPNCIHTFQRLNSPEQHMETKTNAQTIAEAPTIKQNRISMEEAKKQIEKCLDENELEL